MFRKDTMDPLLTGTNKTRMSISQVPQPNVNTQAWVITAGWWVIQSQNESFKLFHKILFLNQATNPKRLPYLPNRQKQTVADESFKLFHKIFFFFLNQATKSKVSSLPAEQAAVSFASTMRFGTSGRGHTWWEPPVGETPNLREQQLHGNPVN